MINPEYLATDLEEIFTRIQNEQMKGIPILNYAIRVETVGFQEWDGCCVGILITPWFMNLMLFPKHEGEWDDLAVGKKQTHKLPADCYEFTINEFEGIGRCQSYPIHSPMNEFVTHEDALSVARTFMEVLMIAVDSTESDEDEARFSRFLEGDEMVRIQQDELEKEAVSCQCPSLKDEADRVISRRDLLRGNFQGFPNSTE
ncbi:MAG: [NiFe]-hydrogenase assembly chaperone HybE [Sedimenticola sp.]